MAGLPATVEFVVLKPTLRCQASCWYCCSPPESKESPGWDDARLERIVGFVAARARPDVPLQVQWHGGEPTLCGVAFFRRAADLFAEVLGPNGFQFHMQTNLLNYGSAWRDLYREQFASSVATSYEPGGERSVAGSPDRFAHLFEKKLEAALDDGLSLMVTATLTAAALEAVPDRLYAMAMARYRAAGDGFAIRFNPLAPYGRAATADQTDVPDSRAYGDRMVRLAERWLEDGGLVPLEPVGKLAGQKLGQGRLCPATATCGGRYVAVLPDGSVWNCPEFANIGPMAPEFCYGNALGDLAPAGARGTVAVRRGGTPAAPPGGTPVEPLRSGAARVVASRPLQLPPDCRVCPHLAACGGGCMADALLYRKGLGGKFSLCAGWMRIFEWADANRTALRALPDWS